MHVPLYFVTQVFTAAEFNRYNSDVLCLMETKINEQGKKIIHVPVTSNKCYHYNSRYSNATGLLHVAGLLRRKRVESAVLEWERISSCIAGIMMLERSFNITIIAADEPIRDSPGPQKDIIYDQLQNTVDRCLK